MLESPYQANFFIASAQGGRDDQRIGSHRSSPKTPVHPSNGYAAMIDAKYQQPASASLRKSPRKTSRRRSSIATANAVQGNGTSHDNMMMFPPPDMKRSTFEAPQVASPRPPPQDFGDDQFGYDIAIAVSRDDDPDDDFAVVSQEDAVPPSLEEADATISASADGDDPSNAKPRHRRKSTGDASKTARRRSARLESKNTLDPLTPEPKKAAAEPDSKPEDESSHESNDLISLDMMEDDSEEVSKPSSRRRSRRIQAKMSPLPSSDSHDVDVATKKRQAKRRQSSAGSGSKKKARKHQCSVDSVGEKEVRANCAKGESQLPSPKKLDLDQKEAELEQVEPPVVSSLTFEIGMSEKGHIKLAEALEKMALDVVFAPNVSKRKSAGRGRKKRGSRGKASSVLEALELDSNATCADAVGSGKENVLNGSAKTVRTKRRDTFDLSKKRGLTGPAKRVELNVFIDNEAALYEGPNLDYVTPKAGSNEVSINALVGELSRTLDDEPIDGHNHGDVEATVSPELAAVQSNLQNLTSIAIEEKMRELFPERMSQVYKYPCVSARIIAAMSIVYEDEANFIPLLSFLLSLLDAEIVSLKSKDETEICTSNRKVFFSAFDYSSTTTALGAVIGQGGGDMRPSIEALGAVLQQALKLPRPVHYLGVAIQCLQCMASYGNASEACANTVFGYFPSTRFTKAFQYYLDEFKDIKNYILSPNTMVGDDHFGVRYRINDFIGRSVRFHLRELLNTIPENVVDFNVDECEERWGRAVDDRSISSILNFSLERIHELMLFYPKSFEYGVQNMPEFFARKESKNIYSFSRDDLKVMDNSTYESLMIDITEARSFLLGARACKFVLELLSNDIVEQHVSAVGGWGAVEAISSTFYKLNLYEGSENEHFVQLREVRDLIFMLEDVDKKFEETVEHCEFCIRRLRRKLSFKSNNNSCIYNIKRHLAGEKEEHFPVVVT